MKASAGFERRQFILSSLAVVVGGRMFGETARSSSPKAANPAIRFAPLASVRHRKDAARRNSRDLSGKCPMPGSL